MKQAKIKGAAVRLTIATYRHVYARSQHPCSWDKPATIIFVVLVCVVCVPQHGMPRAPHGLCTGPPKGLCLCCRTPPASEAPLTPQPGDIVLLLHEALSASQKQSMWGTCHVPGCAKSLTGLRDFHQRFQICDDHIKACPHPSASQPKDTRHHHHLQYLAEAGAGAPRLSREFNGT